VAPGLIARGDVDLLLLGAQTVFRGTKDRKPTNFIATAGTGALLRAAHDYEIGVAVLAEPDKWEDDEPVPESLDFRPRVVAVTLSSDRGGSSDPHARLRTISEELCPFPDDAEVHEHWIGWGTLPKSATAKTG
jgi:hypothetical protein